jgi:hypothetical protein
MCTKGSQPRRRGDLPAGQTERRIVIPVVLGITSGLPTNRPEHIEAPQAIFLSLRRCFGPIIIPWMMRSSDNPAVMMLDLKTT